jgi:hypothetical protein
VIGDNVRNMTTLPKTGGVRAMTDAATARGAAGAAAPQSEIELARFLAGT